MLPNVRWSSWLLVIVTVPVAVVLLLRSQHDTVARSISGLGPLPGFHLIESDGRMVTSDDLRGKVSVMTFIFTRCTESCPLQTARMAELQRQIDDERLRLVSVTIDPIYDTPAVLSAYATRVGASRDRWLFLTGAPDAVWRFMGDTLRLPAPARPAAGGPVSIPHASGFLLMDRALTVRGYYGSDPAYLEQLRRDTLALLCERPAPTVKPPS